MDSFLAAGYVRRLKLLSVLVHCIDLLKLFCRFYLIVSAGLKSSGSDLATVCEHPVDWEGFFERRGRMISNPFSCLFVKGTTTKSRYQWMSKLKVSHPFLSRHLCVSAHASPSVICGRHFHHPAPQP